MDGGKRVRGDPEAVATPTLNDPIWCVVPHDDVLHADTPHDSYAALRNREFRWFIVSLFTMVVGTQCQAVVVGWQVFGITHDPLSLGLIGLAEALPFIAIALPAGYLADRRNRRTISALSLLVLALCSVALLVLSATPGLLARTGV